MAPSLRQTLHWGSHVRFLPPFFYGWLRTVRFQRPLVHCINSLCHMRSVMLQRWGLPRHYQCSTDIQICDKPSVDKHTESVQTCSVPIRPCAFFSMFLVTRPRSFSLKSKKKRKTDVKIKLKVVDLASRSATGRKICMFHLQLTGRLHGYCEEEGEKLSPFA